MTGKVVSVNISAEKGTVKKPVAVATVTGTGINGDAHAGAWHRQVSLLGMENIRAMSGEAGREFQPGEFAENITTTGIDLAAVRLRDLFRIGPVELEVTQIGKECHGSGCAIFREIGRCVMPKQGIFTRVVRGGEVRTGDRVEHVEKPLKALVITLSDRASRGEYSDRSGPAIREALEKHFAVGHWRLATEGRLLPDDAAMLSHEIKSAVAAGTDMIFTTGGTGIGPRDITPDIVRPMLDREIPGIMEFIRCKHGQTIPSALLSRSVAGLIGDTLIFTLPGSVKAAGEYMTVILEVLDHSLLMLGSVDAHVQHDP